MSEHTPGPWQDIGNCRIHGTPAYVGEQEAESEWQGVPVNSINEVCVAFPASLYAYSKNGKDHPIRRDVQERWWARNKANIRLICAAPDLLDALKAMLPEANTDETHCRPSFETCEKAREAIAKAEGRS